jgi:hypothetical protein
MALQQGTQRLPHSGTASGHVVTDSLIAKEQEALILHPVTRSLH